MKLLTIAALSALALSALDLPLAYAQVPTQTSGGLPADMTPDQLAQLLQQNPQLGGLVRQRLQQSGLTLDQVREQLAASGYPPNLLDQFFAAQPGQAPPAVGSQEFSALQAIGLITPTVAAAWLRPDTGFIRSRAHPVAPESLAVGNYVFGVDVFGRSTTQFLPVVSGPVPPDYKFDRDEANER